MSHDADDVSGARLAAIRERLPREHVVGAVFVVAMFMNILDTTVVNVALPTLAREFDVGTSSIEWVVTGYLLSLAVFIPASGWVGDRYGTKRTFLFALGVFTTASLLCGLSTTYPMLVAFRILQGVGGGMLAPVGTAMLFREFPPERRAQAARILVVPTAVAPALGPVLGGFLVDHLSWHWIFFINVPIGIGAFCFGLVFLHEHREPATGRFDLLGFSLAGGGLALGLFALSRAPAEGWGAPVTVLSLLGSVVCFATLAPVELRKPHPMLDLRLLRDRLFRDANVVTFFHYASFIGLLFTLPLFLQEARGLSALQSGLTTFPEALGVLVATQTFVPRLYARLGPRRLMCAALLANTLIISSFTLVELDTSLWIIRGMAFLVGLAMGTVFISVQVATFARISPASTGHASAIFQAQRQAASAFGVALVATVLATATSAGAEMTSIDAYHSAFLTSASLAFIGAIMALRVHDADAAATMRPREPQVVPLAE